MDIRDALKSDSNDLAYLINLAGEGIPEFLWAQMAEPGESPLQVGARRAAREEGDFSYRNARVCTENNQIIAMALCYRLPDPYLIGDLQEFPELVRPLVELEAMLPGSWYINAIATQPSCRGRGAARQLLEDSERRARFHECRQTSLIVASENAGARSLYQHLGFRILATRPVVPYPGAIHAGDWELMSRAV